MNTPTEFAKLLENEFGGRFRLRWSSKQSEYQLEQKMQRGQVFEPLTNEKGEWDTYDDNWIRASEGYWLVMSIRNGDRMPCPSCRHEVKVPVMETKESKCFYCGEIYKAAYYPLNHTLIEHIKDIDPLNGGPDRVGKRVRSRQLAKLDRDRNEVLDNADDQVKDHKIQVDNQPMVGYGYSPSRKDTTADTRLGG